MTLQTAHLLEPYLNNAEPMRRPDYRAKKHGKPMPVRYRRVRKEDEVQS